MISQIASWLRLNNKIKKPSAREAFCLSYVSAGDRTCNLSARKARTKNERLNSPYLSQMMARDICYAKR